MLKLLAIQRKKIQYIETRDGEAACNGLHFFHFILLYHCFLFFHRCQIFQVYFSGVLIFTRKQGWKIQIKKGREVSDNKDRLLTNVENLKTCYLLNRCSRLLTYSFWEWTAWTPSFAHSTSNVFENKLDLFETKTACSFFLLALWIRHSILQTKR